MISRKKIPHDKADYILRWEQVWSSPLVTTEENKRHARDQGSSKKMREMRTEVRDVPGSSLVPLRDVCTIL
jgi:hypothetical protein